MSATAAGVTGRIDMTMMYAIHNAFRRDLALLASCANSDNTIEGAAFEAGWTTFRKYLTIHHTAEDRALWPVVRTKLAGRPDELAVIEAMEAEHDALDPLMDEVQQALDRRDWARLCECTEDLSKSLMAHLDHEEADALPVLKSVLSQEEWKAFGDEQRRRVGISGAAAFFPWLLDGAPESTQHRVLGLLPRPLRFVYRAVWGPRYERRSPWRGAYGLADLDR